MQNRSFIQNPDFVIEDMEGELLLYRPGTHKAIFLNETAAVVWKLCDGTRTVNEIALLLGRSFPESATGISADVQQAVEMLSSEGAVLEAT